MIENQQNVYTVFLLFAMQLMLYCMLWLIHMQVTCYHLVMVISTCYSETMTKQVLNLIPVNPFKPNGISQYYQLEQSISVLRDVGWHFSF